MCEGTAGCVEGEAGLRQDVWNGRNLAHALVRRSYPVRYFTLSLPFYDYVLCDTLNGARGQNSSPCSSSCSPRTSTHLPTKEPTLEQG